VCREARHRGINIPILLLTARVEVGDRVAGLDAGADDYLVKPFVIDELLARCRALLRRSQPTGAGTQLRVGDLTLNSLTREVHRGDRAIELTKTEFDLLELLMQQPGIVVSRETIYETIWGYNFETNSKSLDVYIGYLRRKTEENNGSRVVFTVRGVGYTVKQS
jgi:two-component system response regulator MprA